MNNPEHVVESLGFRKFRAEVYEASLPTGITRRFFRVKAPDAVTVLPITSDGMVALLRQYRPSIGKWIYEAPAGTLEPGEKPEETALREVEEETGLRPRRLELVARGYISPGYSTEYMYYYLAWDPVEGEPRPDEDEVLEVHWFKLQDALDMIWRGEIEDSKTILILLIAEAKMSK